MIGNSINIVVGKMGVILHIFIRLLVVAKGKYDFSLEIGKYI